MEEAVIEYSVVLKRWRGSSRPDVYIFSSEDREAALKAMRKYSKEEGFSIRDPDGRHTIANIVLIEKEPIAGSPIISETSYIELFDD